MGYGKLDLTLTGKGRVMYYLFEAVNILTGKYEGQTGVIVDTNISHNPTLYEVVVDGNDGVVIALYEPEITLVGEDTHEEARRETLFDYS